MEMFRRLLNQYPTLLSLSLETTVQFHDVIPNGQLQLLSNNDLRCEARLTESNIPCLAACLRLALPGYSLVCLALYGSVWLYLALSSSVWSCLAQSLWTCLPLSGTLICMCVCPYITKTRQFITRIDQIRLVIYTSLIRSSLDLV